MITVFGIRPAWGLPCVSPYVTKLVFWLRMNGLPFELRAQDPATLATDSPNGMLPYVVLPAGQRVADSAKIIEQLGQLHAAPMEAGLTQQERATTRAITRWLDDVLYWDGVIAPRWVDDTQWPNYRAELFGPGELPPEAMAMAKAYRSHIVGQWREALKVQGSPDRGDLHPVAAVKALESQLGGRPFMLGDVPRSVDAAAAAMLAHLIDPPFDSEAAFAARSSPALPGFVTRVRRLTRD